MLNERNIPLEEDGIEEEILVDEEVAITKAMWGDIGGNIENQTDLQNALDAKQDSLTESQLNAVNSGITAVKVTTYDGYADQIASKADQSALNAETIARGQADTALGTRIDNEALARQSADNGLQTQIDAITSKSDVVDVVANYATLQAYDTSTLGNNDVVKVLDDETHEDALTYYRWSTTTQTWSYIGQEAPYYSKGQMDVMLQGKQDTLTAGANVQIENGTISATDTTYTAGNGLNLNGTEFSADTTVLATKTDLESYYTKPETDNLLALKLEAEVVAELPTTGAEGKLYLTPKAHTTQTATGNPITATVAEDAGKIESFQLDGDTYQQSYTGKNLFNFVSRGTDQGLTATYDTATGTISVTGTAASNYSNISNAVDLALEEGQTFTSSIDRELPVRAVTRVIYTDNTESSFTIEPGQTSVTWSPMKQVKQIRLYISLTVSGTSYNLSFKFQIEAGSTASSFEPFVGGQPSPSPEYPQPIQTVTGLQTISINGTGYPLDLGDIELCGLGDDGNGNPLYKDYIYPDGNNWKVHKECDSGTSDIRISGIAFNSSGASTVSKVGAFCSLRGDNPSIDYDNTLGRALASENIGTYKLDTSVTGNAAAESMQDGTFCQRQGTNDRIYFKNSAYAGKTGEQIRAIIAATQLGGTNYWYPLATATDTAIADTTLIAQLEAIRTASLQNGANTISNAATGSNLAGDMEIGYYGFNPRNRYDKWLWLDINNEYEQIGS